MLVVNKELSLSLVPDRWIGMFNGVMPGSFAIGHSSNHHKYNNSQLDLVSTADKPRDQPAAFVTHVTRIFMCVPPTTRDWKKYYVKTCFDLKVLISGGLVTYSPGGT